MALQRQNAKFSFTEDLDTKSDPFQVNPGKFVALENISFDTVGLFKKSDGYPQLPTLPVPTNSSLTTFQGGLLSFGSSLYSLSQSTNVWSNQGPLNPIDLSVVPAVRNANSQSGVDQATAPNGLSCVVFVDSVNGAQYQIVELSTGRVVTAAVTLPSGATLPRVFLLGNYFIVTYLATISAVTRLQYIPIFVTTLVAGAGVDISTQVSSLSAPYDAVVTRNSAYFAWNGSDGGGAVRMRILSSTLSQSTVVVIAGVTATLISMTADNSASSPIIWLTYYNSGTSNGSSGAYNTSLTQITAPFAIITGEVVTNLTTVATGGTLNLFYQVTTTYPYGTQTYANGTYTNGTANTVRTDIIKSKSSTLAGTVTANGTFIRGLGLASKAFLLNGSIYLLSVYQSTYQNTYFLLNSSAQTVTRLAYENAGAYVTGNLTNVSVYGNTATLGYLFKDFIASVSTASTQAPIGGIYTQTGVNLANFTVQALSQSVEAGGSLHLSGGLLWQYDGVKTVEHNFHLFPDNLGVDLSTTGGSMAALQYFYIAVYEWTDLAGMIHRSAPSVPLSANRSTSGTSTNMITVYVPTLRNTLKGPANSVRIVLYRWSTANPVYYQVTSISSPKLNDTTADNISYIDTVADANIVGNNLLYTSGGVVEDIAAPAFSAMTLYKARLFGITSEDRNTLWYSKQIISGTPVEMSDLFTLYVPPTPTDVGGLTALAAMDDKLILFKKAAIKYIAGIGPDNAGANNDFSDTVAINSTVGCSNPNSIVLIPNGLMFQSQKGIWLLGRDLSTQYIGAFVEAYNSETVLSAVNLASQNLVRFTLSSGTMLSYDYFLNKWSVRTSIKAGSACLYLGAHTYLSQSTGQVYQNTKSTYIDGSKPVCMKMKTGWLNFAGLQGFQRVYFFQLLGKFLSPHTLQISIAYDFEDSPSQTVTISPTNYSAAYGGDSLYGGSSSYGGGKTREQWQIELERQKCESIQVTIEEFYDASYGVPAGAGLTLSGINFEYGIRAGSFQISDAKVTG